MLSASLNKTFPSFLHCGGVQSSCSNKEFYILYLVEGMFWNHLDSTAHLCLHERSLVVGLVVGSILHGVDPLSYFSFQPELHDWCNKGRGMYYPVCGMMHIKEPLLLIGKSSLCGGSGFPLQLSEWSFTICLTPYNRK